MRAATQIQRCSGKAVSLLCCIILFAFTQHAVAQTITHLTIDEAYERARVNYPLVKQRDLITRTADYTVANAAKGHIPTFSLSGQASYQSAVPTIAQSLPGFSFPVFSKDQYKFYAEADQLIYDGGQIKNQKKTARANEVAQQQNLEVQLYALYDRINQLFLGILLLNEQLKQNGLLQKDIQNGIDKTKAMVANGVAYRSNVDELSATLLNAEQSRIQLAATKKAYLDMLSVFVNETVDETTILEKPTAPTYSDIVDRPEISYYDYQKSIYDLQQDLLKVQLRPRLSAFIQGGYSRPGLNYFSNDFAWFYITGLRLSWNLGTNLYTLRNQRNILNLNKDNLDIQKETFLFNTSITQRQQNSEIIKYLQMMKDDDEIVRLRESVKKTSAAQLENGVINVHDYIGEINAADEARQNKALHEMQLLQAQFNYQNTVGNMKTRSGNSGLKRD